MKINYDYTIYLSFLLYALVLSEPFDESAEQDEGSHLQPWEKLAAE